IRCDEPSAAAYQQTAATHRSFVLIMRRTVTHDAVASERIGGESVPTLLAKNADVLATMDGERRELRDAGLLARDGVIEQVVTASERRESADAVIDLSGQVVLPGLINCHDQLDQVLTRNL